MGGNLPEYSSVQNIQVLSVDWLLVVGTTEVDSQLIDEALEILAATSASNDQSTLPAFQHSWKWRGFQSC